MATVPSPSTWVAGNVVTAAQLNAQIRDTATFLITPPSLYCYQNTAQATLTTAVSTLITFDTNVYDTDTGGATHSTSSLTSRINPKTAGYHLVTASLTFTSNATGTRWLIIRKNAAGSNSGGTVVGYRTVAAVTGDVTAFELNTAIQFNGTTDYIEIFAIQSSGGNLTVFTYTGGTNWINAVSVQTRFLNS